MQERVHALRTVLPLLHDHLHMICPVHVSTNNLESGSGGEVLVSPHDTRLSRVPNPGIDESDYEAWERVRQVLYRAYRLAAVYGALERLSEQASPHASLVAHAVYYEYVEPWPEFEAERRYLLAEVGLRWMAHEIPGDLFACEAGARHTWRATVKTLHAEGHGIKEIARRTGHSRNSVRAALRGTPNTHRKAV